MKKKTKVALAAVTELVGYELEFAWEYAKYIRGESFCVEEAACGLSQLEVDTVGLHCHCDRSVVRSEESHSSESVDGRLGLSRAGRAAHELKAMRNRQDYVGAEVAHGFLSSEEDEDTEFGMVEGSHYTPADSEKTSAPASWASRAFDSLVDRS